MSMILDVPNSEAAILSRAFQPERGDLSPEAARSFLGIKISESDQKRASELATKAREGSLNASEEAELNNYRDVGRLIELLKSKARMSLEQSTLS